MRHEGLCREAVTASGVAVTVESLPRVGAGHRKVAGSPVGQATRAPRSLIPSSTPPLFHLRRPRRRWPDALHLKRCVLVEPHEPSGRGRQKETGERSARLECRSVLAASNAAEFCLGRTGGRESSSGTLFLTVACRAARGHHHDDHPTRAASDRGDVRARLPEAPPHECGFMSR